VVVLARATTATAAMELAVFCCAMAGSAVGFLAHNRYRAVMFMGDTGSLALGGVRGSPLLSLKRNIYARLPPSEGVCLGWRA
jgi:UDP-N-acetylmuramyl pentapeptide phosphotransferase/UDP-N-acetylglucosamine-1-phosphate transferase